VHSDDDDITACVCQQNYTVLALQRKFEIHLGEDAIVRSFSYLFEGACLVMNKQEINSRRIIDHASSAQKRFSTNEMDMRESDWLDA